MKKLKDILVEVTSPHQLNEYVDSSLMALKRYLSMSTKEKKVDLLNVFEEQHGSKTVQLLLEMDKLHHFILYDYTENVQDVTQCNISEIEKKYPELYEDFLVWMGNIITYKLYSQLDIKSEYLPSWVYMRDPEILKNQWLIHGTDREDASDILRNGFVYGVQNMRQLGLTTFIDKKGVGINGYNFAYTIDDFSKYGTFSSNGVKTVKYGDMETFLMFRASGIRCWHGTDVEHQVIFTGNTARDMVLVIRHNNAWEIPSRDKGKPLVKFTDIEDIPLWVSKNYVQYRKAMVQA